MLKTDATYALEAIDEAIEMVDELLPQYVTYNVGNSLNARHYLLKAREQVQKLVDGEPLHGRGYTRETETYNNNA